MADPTTAATIQKPRPGRTITQGKDKEMAAKTEAETPPTEDAPSKRGGKKKVVLVALVVVVAVAALYLLVLKPHGGGAAAAPKPVPGAVVKLDPITLNLAGGHFLKLGLSLQATADAGEDVSGAKALDAAIDLFSNKTIKDLTSTEGRDKAKSDLVKRVSGLYEGKVYDIYFTDFVMQ
ncbi:MAG TPA: flagellar basal body-associated FliL family protein [Kineosporiaceae bacterium]|nr:flagellar basal body-associated FliL family protein [Kineosporiaceae bacterium]